MELFHQLKYRKQIDTTNKIFDQLKYGMVTRSKNTMPNNITAHDLEVVSMHAVTTLFQKNSGRENLIDTKTQSYLCHLIEIVLKGLYLTQYFKPIYMTNDNNNESLTENVSMTEKKLSSHNMT